LTLALTLADRQYTAVARPTRLSVAPDEARHSLLINDLDRGIMPVIKDQITALRRHNA
jgi:hypothetical protein